MLCYSSVDFNSLTELETVIWPDLSEKFPDVPVILVATKCDARDVSSANEDDHEEIWQIEEDSSDHSSMKSMPLSQLNFNLVFAAATGIAKMHIFCMGAIFSTSKDSAFLCYTLYA